MITQTRSHYLRELGHPDAEKHAAGVAAIRAKIAGRPE